MRIKVAIVVIGVSASAFAVERLPGSGLYARYATEQNSAAQAAQERFYQRSERIAAAAIGSICTGCLGLRHNRLSEADRLDTSALVASAPERQPKRRAARPAQPEELPAAARRLLLSRLIVAD